ncbi:Exostosin family protein [Flavobacterium glycines]|uniref:Exostosin family protein n=1 Tax=Flavobacterium glycines TaxID=551990 RepID=A0A1B9DH43_9FLAO|nr:hypothetical protein [Flavobacterium glycines]OCB69042.1 hypothetical protein FBGL_13470 [Flavobacterium glycines]GEL12410.1 hypothetical protein FGL01_31490 [Flavobacterium glycines]SDJ52418.1 Exostosin family protein [Flavobacterium glycines]
MLKLYVNPVYLIPENRKFVFPLLFDLWYVPNANLLEKYQIVSEIAHCDIVVVPIDIARFDSGKSQQKLNDFINRALDLDKKVWLYSGGDYGKSISMNNQVYTFRLSGFASQLNAQTFILPSFVNDPYSSLSKEFRTIGKLQQAQIGFVGHANNSFFKKIKEYLLFLKYNFRRFIGKIQTDYQRFYPSGVKRFLYLKLLKKNPEIITDFIFRNQYRAGVKTEEEKKKTTMEFLENIESNPYTFCMRGVGNFSVRFYETLAMGRIPFVIDTDFSLPLSHEINWEKHCVIAKSNEIAESLIHFHKNCSFEDFELMQQNNRKLWQTHLQRDAYFLKIYSLFKADIQ